MSFSAKFNLSRLEEANRLSKFSHEAMATVYEIFIADSDSKYAGQAAAEAFREIDAIENELSRFRENSDISALNSLAEGESLVVGVHAFACLTASMEYNERTAGAFDVTIGDIADAASAKERSTKTALLELNADDRIALLVNGKIDIDLGGIGKGYAVDRITEILAEWEIGSALIQGGKSSVYAHGKPEGESGWQFDITISDESKSIFIAGSAISASGLEKDQHIIDPVNPGSNLNCSSVLLASQSAMEGDALSTAFMIMDDESRKRYCEKYPDISAITATQEDKEIFIYGKWNIDNLFM